MQSNSINIRPTHIQSAKRTETERENNRFVSVRLIFEFEVREKSVS